MSVRTPVRNLLLACSLIGTLLSPLTIVAQTKGKSTVKTDEASIIQLHQDFAAAWSNGDVDGVMALYADSAVRVGAAGDIEHGRAEIKAAYERLLSGSFKGAQVQIDSGTVRILSQDLALWQAPMEIRPAGGPSPINGYALDVMRKIDGRWRILETHPKLFPPSPGTVPR